jgi:glucose-1-phosphate thymidylyltransferase
MEAGEFVRTIENRQGFRIGCVEEIAYRQGWIDAARLSELAGDSKSPYAAYLRTLAQSPAPAPGEP